MRKSYLFPRSIFFAALLLLPASQSYSAHILDDFNDNTKTDWQDFTFVPGFGIPSETGGQFVFSLPPAGRAIFTGSRKTSEEFELKNGRTIEFRVDLVEGIGADSFAVLAFIPVANGLDSLAGYGLAKSETDLLLTKGIAKYFYNENVTPAVKNNNVTMVLTLSAKDGTVTIHGQILDKDNGNAVIWDQTAIDTPAADVLSDGTDDPAAPYLTRGHFALYCYEDDGTTQPLYQVTFDNATTCVLDDVVLDDFDDNVKTGWSDFTFVPGFGIPEEANGQFTFTLPPAGRAIFTGSRKTSRVFDLRECDHLQFRVDLVNGIGADSFAVLAFIPEANGLDSLAGYGLAKSETDLLLTKGIAKYFYNENVTPAVKNNNVTLVLDLSVSNSTTVYIKGQVLDKDNNNAVLWEQTAVDSPEADVLSDGTDDPAAPYLTTGHFALYCYEDDGTTQPLYQVIYDNAMVLAPALAANQPPQISDVTPGETDNFLPSTTKITFRAADDKPLLNNLITVTLNGTVINSGNGLIITGAGNTRDVSLGGLDINKDYTAELQVVDSDGATNKVLLHFDTFDPGNLSIEMEDYNFTQGGFIDFPVLIPEGAGPQGGSYNNQQGVATVDFNDTRAAPNGNDTRYRSFDPVRMQHTLDKARQQYIDAGGTAAGIYDYDVGDIVGGEWLNYTRTFTAGSYLIYLRQSLVNVAQAECALEKVTGDTFAPDQTTVPLGSFRGRLTGFTYRNVLLTDASGQPVVVRLTDVETLRLRQVTTTPGDGGISQNYLVLIPTADPGIQRARVASVSPADGSTAVTVAPVVTATIQNFDTAVDVDTIQLLINDHEVTADVTPNATGATVTYTLEPLPPSGAVNHARLIFSDDFHVKQTNDWTFTISYKALNPANRAAVAGPDRGFRLRMVQAPAASGLDNSLTRAEAQLAIPSTIPVAMDTNTVISVINQDKILGSSSGFFPNDNAIPGLYDDAGNTLGNGLDDFTVECVAWLDLAPGVYTFGARTDDGYKCSSGTQLHDSSAGAFLGFHSGGPASETFDFVVSVGGLYPFRFLWYERGGSGYGEFFSVDRSTGDRTLINDPLSPTAIKAYLAVINVSLQSASEVGGPYADDAAATLDATQSTFTIAANGARRFYRLRADSKFHIDSIRQVEGNLEIKYSAAP